MAVLSVGGRQVRLAASRVEVMTDSPVPQSSKRAAEESEALKSLSETGLGILEARKVCLARSDVKKSRMQGAPAPHRRRQSAAMPRQG